MLSHRVLEASNKGTNALSVKSLCPALLLMALSTVSSRAVAEETGRDNIRLNWGKASETDLTTAIFGDFKASQESEYLVGGSWGRRLSPTMFGLPIELTGNVGLQWVNSRGLQDDGYGINAYIKAHYSWRLPWTQKHVRFGLGEGVSYLSEIPLAEQRDFAKKGPDVTSEKLMNYVEWTVDVPLRQFSSMDKLITRDIDDIYFGFFIFHRSSVFGVFAETKGGINFMGFGIEARY